MKIYKVEIEKLSFDYGYFLDWDLVGYYMSKEKAERVAKEEYDNRCVVDQGETRVMEIEVDTGQ